MKKYNVIIRVKENDQHRFLKYRGVHKVQSLLNWLKEKGIEADYINLYNSETKEKLFSASIKDLNFNLL